MQYLTGFRVGAAAWAKIGAAIGLAVLAGGAGIGLMGLSAWLLSRAAEHPPVLYLMVAIVLVRTLGLSRGVFRYLERLVAHDVAFRLLADLRVRTYERLADTLLLGRRRGDLLSRLTADVEAIVDVVVRVLVPLASAMVLTVATTMALMNLSPSAGLLVLASAAVAGGLVPWFSAHLSRRADASLAPIRGHLSNLLTEATGSATDLLAYGADVAMLRRVQEVDDQLRRAEQRTAAIQGVATALQVLTSALAVLGSLAVAARSVESGQLAPVYVAVLVLTPIALHETLANLPAVTQAWTRSSSALSRVAEVLTTRPTGAGDRADAPQVKEPGRVLADDLSIGWPGLDTLAEHVTFRVDSGDRLAVTGPSGRGKTTLAATLLDIIAPRSGHLAVDGRVGYLAQDAHLFDTTVAENVRIGNRDATDEEIRAALHAVRLDLALDRTVGEHGGNVSGGEARRIALARLLVGDHDVIILDEPTEHLDGQTAEDLMADIWRLFSDAAMVVITHDPVVRDACPQQIEIGPAIPVPV